MCNGQNIWPRPVRRTLDLYRRSAGARNDPIELRLTGVFRPSIKSPQRLAPVLLQPFGTRANSVWTRHRRHRHGDRSRARDPPKALEAHCAQKAPWQRRQRCLVDRPCPFNPSNLLLSRRRPMGALWSPPRGTRWGVLVRQDHWRRHRRRHRHEVEHRPISPDRRLSENLPSFARPVWRPPVFPHDQRLRRDTSAVLVIAGRSPLLAEPVRRTMRTPVAARPARRLLLNLDPDRSRNGHWQVAGMETAQARSRRMMIISLIF